MLVEHMLQRARERLATLRVDENLIAAARLLRAGTDIVALVDGEGTLVGVVTKTDIVAQISVCEGRSCGMTAALAMTREVVTCRCDDQLAKTWQAMKTRGLKNIPIIDAEMRVIGMLTARDALEALKQEVENEEALLRDYVMCVGYQ